MLAVEWVQDEASSIDLFDTFVFVSLYKAITESEVCIPSARKWLIRFGKEPSCKVQVPPGEEQ